MSEWRNPVWPTPPGEIPIDDGVFWVSMYGWVRIGYLWETSKGRRIRICFADGSPMPQWDGAPVNDFMRYQDTLYTAWKPMTLPMSWQDSEHQDDEQVRATIIEMTGDTDS